jgi:DNA-directed RNA polymerase specialized sigma24 family protein
MPDREVDAPLSKDYGTNFAEQERLHQQKLLFDTRFWRCYRTLHLIASRVLGGPGRAIEAIESCWRTASRHTQRFEQEGEFYSWLLRVLIDEAVVLVRENPAMPTPKMPCEPIPAQIFQSNCRSNGEDDIRDEGQNRLSEDRCMGLEE